MSTRVFLLIFMMARWILRLRYRVRFKGLSETSAQGTIFLPNHPTQIDPILLMIFLWPKFRLRSLVTIEYSEHPFFRFFLNGIQALIMPDRDKAMNWWNKKLFDCSFQPLLEGLKNGDNFLIYPAGRLKRSEQDTVDGSSIVHRILQHAPQTRIALIRTTGLWGSSFSRALTRKPPPFFKTCREGIKAVLKNGLFFTPRRKIDVEIYFNPPNFPYQESRISINRYLENWYNEIPDPLNLVFTSFWKKNLPDVAPVLPPTKKELPIPTALQQEIIPFLAELAKVSAGTISPETRLAQDLGLDSLDMVQVYTFLSQKYEIAQIPFGAIQTVNDVLQAAAGAPFETSPRTTAPFKWPDEPNRLPPVEEPLGKTIQEVFFKICDRMGNSVAAADETSGVATYRKLKIGALALAAEIRRLPGKKVGLLLPASVGTYLTIFATLLAGKIPVMLNWTLGIRLLKQAVDLTQLETILTARRFLERVKDIDLSPLEAKLVLLEDLRGKIGWRQKGRAAFLSLKKPERLLKYLRLNQEKEDDCCVLLFTSGTEKLPKAVPLSHKNLLSEQRGLSIVYPTTREDIFYGFLPPFHAIGFAVTGILEILIGLKIYYSPDMTDIQTLVRDIGEKKLTLCLCLPSLLQKILALAKPSDLRSLRILMTAGEKNPEGLIERAQSLLPDCRFIAIYGTTECSPGVSGQRLGEPPQGVGKPFPGVEVCIIHPETLQLLPPEQEGELCVHGPIVFSGYFVVDPENAPPSPFIQINNRSWYRTGDRARLDPEGNIFLSGRLKRFIKIGGEMIDLDNLEREIHRFSLEKNWHTNREGKVPLAVFSYEAEDGKPHVVLCSTFDISKDTVNRALRESGYPNLFKISEVRLMKDIPLTATGKIAYRLLN